MNFPLNFTAQVNELKKRPYCNIKLFCNRFNCGKNLKERKLINPFEKR